MSYFGHSKFAFFYNGSNLFGVLRYVLAHLFGYGTNIALLYTFVDMLGYPHQLIQAIAIFIVAGILFLLLRYYVFPQKALA
jgi:putative flippase GtrA